MILIAQLSMRNELIINFSKRCGSTPPSPGSEFSYSTSSQECVGAYKKGHHKLQNGFINLAYRLECDTVTVIMEAHKLADPLPLSKSSNTRGVATHSFTLVDE